MGVVYRAEDRRLKREVAIKLMLPQLAANPEAKARFVREARAQAAVEHDHVAAIHQVGEHAGVPFLVMPLLRGMTLQAALKANPRPPLVQVVRIGREIAEGLAAAHERGLVHRDIKPANVWLEGRRLRVKILDFGLARATADAGGSDPAAGPVTIEGAVVGTPSYMSPEQARGRSVDGRTDLWSLGVVLYQMTTGQLPFRGKTALAILTELVRHDPPSPVALNPAVPPGLSELVTRLLSKDPAGRPASAEAVADELRQVELGLADGVRAVPLDAAPGAPVAIPGADPSADPFTDLDAAEVSPVADGAPRRPAGDRSSGRRGVPPWPAVAVAVLLAAAGLAWIAARQFGDRPPGAKDEPAPRKEAPAAEPWADPKMPVRDGLELWLDARTLDAAAKATRDRVVIDGRLAVWPDGSGRSRHVRQPLSAARPRVVKAGGAPLVRFDGENEHLRFTGGRGELKAFTAFVVVIPRNNPGDFRGFFALNAADGRDYETGLTIDLGPDETPRFTQLNVEGRGFAGWENLMKEGGDFGRLYQLEVTGDAAGKCVRLAVNGTATGERPWVPAGLSLAEITLGARYYTNEPGPQQVRGWTRCDVAEVLLFNHVLSGDETRKVRAYLNAKHAPLKENVPPDGDGLGRRPVPAAGPPAVPAFTARQLPVDLTDVNDLK
jgi:hypothetical protein